MFHITFFSFTPKVIQCLYLPVSILTNMEKKLSLKNLIPLWSFSRSTSWSWSSSFFSEARCMYPSSWLCVRPTVLRRLSLLTALELISHLKLSNIFVYIVHSQFSPLFSPLSEICVSQLRCADCLYTVYWNTLALSQRQNRRRHPHCGLLLPFS